MKIGINETIEPERIEYYESFYDILRTPDFDDNSRKLIDTFIYYAKVKQMSKKALEAVDI